MSVQGTILVLDGVATNRIMLKVQLTAAWYQVVQGDKLKGLPALLRRTRPDLVIASQTLPDGSASDVKAILAGDPTLSDVPVVAITQQNDKAARVQALADGLDDVLAYPYKDTLLLAHVRSLLRARVERQELQVEDKTKSIGFAETGTALITPAPSSRIAILTLAARTGAIWNKALATRVPQPISSHDLPNLSGVLSSPVPDAIVVELWDGATCRNMLADLRSRAATRHTVLIGVIPDASSDQTAEALDWGVDAVCQGGFDPDEIAVRLKSQIARKRRDDRLRASLRNGLADSLTDPLTGLCNRRFAMRALHQIARQSSQSDRGFAIMLADLDHFKSINDQFGHDAGDQVLTETASRLQQSVDQRGFVARFGGEEFMICLQNVTPANALRAAERICACICSEPFRLGEPQNPILVTISVGLVLHAPPLADSVLKSDDMEGLLKSADRALYAAKQSGRNQVRLRRSAA
ncbi:diguanylate cyclase [Ruegeria sp. ANG-S4]|nr:diguanylate cyclase [Ruegeria sp. ANG-S4]